MSKLLLATSDDTRTVPSAHLALYAKADDCLYQKTDAGTETKLLTASDLASIIGSGTSFPASPASGDLFLRTDRALLYFYDSTLTLWVTLPEYLAVFTPVAAPSTGFTSSTTVANRLVLLPRFASPALVRLTYVQLLCSVSTTNNSSNYWSLAVVTRPAGTTVCTLSTSSGAAGADLALEWSTGSPLPRTESLLQISVTKTGSPGTLYLYSAALTYRYAE